MSKKRFTENPERFTFSANPLRSDLYDVWIRVNFDAG